MSDSTLYDDDILLWSEQQAEVIRRLGRAGRAPNDLDVDNVAEEIESVGRSELATVESQLLLMLIHLIELAIEPDAEAANHWRGEILVFGFNLRRRYSASMRQRIDLDQIWREARRQVAVTDASRDSERVALPPLECPIGLDDLLAEILDIDAIAERLRGRSSTVLE